MGGGTWTNDSFVSYSHSVHKSVDSRGFISSGQEWRARKMDSALDPKGVIRECVNSKEHPNTIPVILALDVTGSMGEACKKTAEALGVIMTDLYSKHKDIEFMIMGIGDVECDSCPIQATQFESDVRIAEQLDKLYMEHGGGGNGYESYTAAWQFGLQQCKLDCWKQGRKGIIITMGDEPLNPVLERRGLNEATGQSNETSIKTPDLYKRACEKYDIFHIAVDDSANCYSSYSGRIKASFGQLLGDRLKISTLNMLHKTISDCIDEAVKGTTETAQPTQLNENGEITW